jgi:TPR repeat protein
VAHNIISLAMGLVFTLAGMWVHAGDAGPTKDEYADLRKKSALVIGIDAYQNATPLGNAVNDAALVRRRLEATGFATHFVADPSLATLRDTVARFLTEARQADIAIVYYAGHAVQIDGDNYMIPVEFDGTRSDIIGQLSSINGMLTQLSEIAKVRIIILDACRDNPFLDRIRGSLGQPAIAPGLAPIALPTFDGSRLGDATYGLVVAYATQPQLQSTDGLGPNGPFATALDQALSNAEEEISAILQRTTRLTLMATNGKQQPEARMALTGKLHLVARPMPLRCDVLAAETDNNIAVNGVAFDELDIAAAEPACRNDLARFPSNPRLMHNLGRVLDKSGRATEALPLYRRAAEIGYDWAQNNLGAELLSGRSAALDHKEGVMWLRKASEQGNPQARVNYTEYDMAPIFAAPKVVLALQQALARTGFSDLPETGKLDGATMSALSAYKIREGLPAVGISLQVIVKLGLIDAVFDPKLRKRDPISKG